MNVYEALLKAADHIERNPDLFDFYTERVPECGTPGCALGWAAYFMRLPFHNVGDFAQQMMPVKYGDCAEGAFYERMNAALADPKCEWTEDSALCAQGMRLVAEKHYGHLRCNFARELEGTLLAEPLELASTCSR